MRTLFVIIAALLTTTSIAHAEIQTKTARAAQSSARKVESLSVDAMLTKINTTYMQGMQRCYVKGLARDSGLQGKVTIVFTVNPWGRVTGTVSGIAPKVDTCITNQVSTWRFPAPRTAKDQPTQATFKINLLLARQ